MQSHTVVIFEKFADRYKRYSDRILLLLTYLFGTKTHLVQYFSKARISL